MSQLALIYNLLMAFDCEEGLPSSVYEAAGDLIKNVLGQRALTIFTAHIDATDGSFYFGDTEAFKACWQKMKEAAMESIP